MPSLTHSMMFAALYVASLGLPFAPLQALASPVPTPLPLMAADYSHINASSARPWTIKNAKTKHSSAHNHTLSLSKTPPGSPVVARDIDYLDILTGYYNSANTHATNYKSLAARSASVQDDDYDFHHACADELTGFQTNLLSFQTGLEEDKGLANYDRSSGLETLLKNIVNINKEVLKDTDVLVYNLPILGPILGPIVYEIKCLLELILDLTENLTDAIANVVLPLLRPLIVKASATCEGLCL